MAEIIDLTVSPRPKVIEISSDQENTFPRSRDGTQEKKRRKRKTGKTPNGPAEDGVNSSAQPSRAHSPDRGGKHGEPNEPTVCPRSASTPAQISSSTAVDEPDFFILDGTAAPITVEESPPEPVEFNGDANKLLLPSHVVILHYDSHLPVEIIPAPKPSSDDEDYIEYLDYGDRKAPGLVRYFEPAAEESNRSKPSIFKCKNCGAEGDHKTFECPIQICLTCGAHDEHSTRSCPISKTCYTCGMKGHINKTCPNRFSAHVASSDFHGDCDRCGSTEHKTNECPTIWRIYQYVNDEERIVIMHSREEKKILAIGEGGEGYISEDLWCYNCANAGHLGDDCDEVTHPATFPTEYSAFSCHNVMSGPFYDPATEPIIIKRGSRERKSEASWSRLAEDWDADVPVDVGKRGKNKDKERLEKRFREQEDEDEDWFNDIRNVKRRGTGLQTRPPESRGKALKFGQIRDGGQERPSPPPPMRSSGSGPSLLARLSDPRGGRNRGRFDHGRDRDEPWQQSENHIRIRGAATNPGNQDSRYGNSRKPDSGRSQDRRDGDKPGNRGPKRGPSHGPRYRGGYDR